MKPNTRRRLLDASVAADEVASFLAGKHLDDLRRDRKLLLSVLKLLEVVGEALHKARKGDRYIESQVPHLRRWVYLRNQIVHEYDKVDIAIIWQMCVEGLPDLRHNLQAVLDGRDERERHRDGRRPRRWR